MPATRTKVCHEGAIAVTEAGSCDGPVGMVSILTGSTKGDSLPRILDQCASNYKDRSIRSNRPQHLPMLNAVAQGLRGANLLEGDGRKPASLWHSRTSEEFTHHAH